MRRLSLLLLCTTLAALLLAVPAVAGNVVQIGQKANGTTVSLHPGDTLAVSLAGNITTGFSWSVVSVKPAVLKSVSRQYVEKKAGPCCGQGGVFILRFRAVAAGRTPLRLGYARPFEKSTPPAQTFAITAVVK